MILTQCHLGTILKSSKLAPARLLYMLIVLATSHQFIISPLERVPSSKAATMLAQNVNEIRKILGALPQVPDSGGPTQEDDQHPAAAGSHGQADPERKAFVVELLKTLHEQYGGVGSRTSATMEDRQGQLGVAPRTMLQLIEALGVDGDVRRLIDWVSNSFSLASIPEVTTQFVVSKLASVNCPALLKPDKEETLMPRFLFFNEDYVDVPFELSIRPDANECAKGKFDPRRKTVLLLHGYLSGYTLIDAMTNIKNRLLELSRLADVKALDAFAHTASHHYNYNHNASSYVFTEDLDAKIRQQRYNVVIVDWLNGANPTPRANYIRAAANAQVVGRLIARFMSALVVQCGSPSSSMQIIAHSLGCHVSGFAGKAMNAAGHRLGKITHLDPIGLCFGRLFSQPRFRLSPNDALDTQAVHVSLNIFDNPLDGAQSNFLVNGGRDQIGCGGQSELKNSTASSLSVLFDPAAKFGTCSHLRAPALFEDDHSSEPGQCQLVGYRCQNYDRFLAGKCGYCDATNAQCRLMSLEPLSMQFRKMSLAQVPEAATNHLANFYSGPLYDFASRAELATLSDGNNLSNDSNSNRSTSTAPHKQLAMSTEMFGAPAYLGPHLGGNELSRRSDRRLSPEKRERIAQALEKLRAETRTVLVDGWTSLRVGASSSKASNPNDGNQHERGPATTDTSAASTSTTALPPSTGQQQQAVVNRSQPVEQASSRLHQDLIDQVPLGGQRIPAGSLNGPLYFLGTGAVSPYCVNYYQFRVLIAESRLERALKSNGLGSNRLAPQLSVHRGGAGLISAAASLQQRVANANGRDMLHLTVKLSDTQGRFFKGFSIVEHARTVARVMSEFAAPPPLPHSGPATGPNEPMVELTMLLNSTRLEPQRIGETIISYYFHQIVLADRVEINYMSNISPEIRAKYSSVLCPVAINDQHQLVKYIECQRVPAAAAAARRRK